MRAKVMRNNKKATQKSGFFIEWGDHLRGHLFVATSR